MQMKNCTFIDCTIDGHRLIECEFINCVVTECVLTTCRIRYMHPLIEGNTGNNNSEGMKLKP